MKRGWDDLWAASGAWEGLGVRCREGLRGPFGIVKLVFLPSFSFHVFILLNTCSRKQGQGRHCWFLVRLAGINRVEMLAWMEPGGQHLDFSRTLLGRRAVLAEHFRMDPKPILSLGKLDGAAGMTENAVPAKRGKRKSWRSVCHDVGQNHRFAATLSCSSCSYANPRKHPHRERRQACRKKCASER